jgi:hypothetical protein
MEKTWKVIKNILICLLVFALLSGLFAFLSGIKGVRDWINGIFGKANINIDEFESAPINWNGGLSKNEIEKQKNDVNCPTRDDMTDTIYIQDYDDIVCFYRAVKTDDGDTIYPNLVFVKTENGLKFNGALNMTGKAVYYRSWYDIVNPAYPWTCGPKAYEVSQDYTTAPSYRFNSLRTIWTAPEVNLCLLDSSDPAFYYVSVSDWFGADACAFNFLYNNNVKAKALQTAQKYLMENIYGKYFLKFCNDNVEIIQEQNNETVANGDFNFFYDYLYRSTLQHDFGTDKDGNTLTTGTCSVDVSKLTVYPLPDSDKTRYPVANTDPQEYYGIYNCNVLMTCNYEKKNVKTVFADSPSVIDGVKDSPIENKDIEPKSMQTIDVMLTPKDKYLNSKIREALKNAPVTFKYFDSNNNLVRTISFNTSDFTDCVATKTTALDNGTYTYKIESGQLLFNAYSGTIKIDNSGNLKYEYSYQDGMVLTSVNIMPNSTDIDYSGVDLSNYPVKIVFNGIDNSNTYQFVFDSTNKVNVTQSALIKIGKYQCTILSEKLIFASSTKTVDITPTNYNFNFPFAVNHSTSDLAFNIKLTKSSVNVDGAIYLSGDSTSVKLLGDKLKQKDYLIVLTVFDQNGNVIETFDHSHDGTSTCSAVWQVEKLTAGTTYVAQLTYNNSDNSIAYTSATFTFTYNLKTAYELVYSCSEVK